MLASAKVSVIWIDQGLDGERTEEARLKAEEVLALLGGGSDLAEVVRFTWKTAPNPPEEISSQRDQNQLPVDQAKPIFAWA